MNKSKTKRQPIGHWPRVRRIEVEVKGYGRYPDIRAGEPVRGGFAFEAAQGESDAAIMRTVRKRIDAAVESVLERVPQPGSEWVVWPVPMLLPMPVEMTGPLTGYQSYTWAHEVARRSPGGLTTVCGTEVGADLTRLAIIGGPMLVTNWGICPRCA